MSLVRRTRSLLSAVRPILLVGVAALAPHLANAQVFKSTAQDLGAGGMDLNWLVSASRTGFTTNFASAYQWAAPGWIANTASGNNAPFGPLVYFDFRQSFDLTGFDASTASLSFQWGCDDVPQGWPVITPFFTVNGGLAQGAGTCGAYNYGQTVTVTGFQAGVNTLDFFLQGNGQTDGLELRTVDVTAVVATPEPATLVLFGTGLIGLVGVVRRRRVHAPE